MAKTLETVRNEVLRRLGDSNSDIWAASEIDRYLNEGYEKLAVRTGILWDCTYLEDQSYAGTHTAKWETEFAPVGFVILNQFHYTADFEADEAFGDRLFLGPANHTTLWEFDDGYVSQSYFVAVHQIPSEVIEIERAVWDSRRIEPLRSEELEGSDGQYQTQQGEVMGYLRDKDGPRSFRKWRIPSIEADQYTVTGDAYAANYTADWETEDIPITFTATNQFTHSEPWESIYLSSTLAAVPSSNHTGAWEFTGSSQYGVLKGIWEISSEEVIGEGLPCIIPGGHRCSGDKQWGVPKRFFKAEHNTKIEYTKKGERLVDDDDLFELPDLYVKYIRHFALYRALERDGNGQDLKFSAFWKGLWEAGVERTRRRKQSTMKTRRHVLGGEMVESRRPPLARLPWQYGRVVR